MQVRFNSYFLTLNLSQTIIQVLNGQVDKTKTEMGTSLNK